MPVFLKCAVPLRNLAVPFILLVLAAPAAGMPVEGLYEVEVRVQGQNPEQQQAGFEAALGKLLVKLTGDPQRARDTALLKAFGDPEALVQQHGYTRDPSPYPGRGPLHLRVAFDETQINPVMQRHGVPIWGANRPGVLVWLGVRDGGEGRLYSPEQDQHLRALAQRAAFARGIPLIFPLMDLEDQANVAPEVFWGGGELAATLRKASGRYGADAILVARLNRRDADWSAEWMLLQGDARDGWTTSAQDPEALIGGGIDRTAAALAEAYAPRPGAAGPGADIVLLRVDGLGSVEDYAALRRYLGGIDSVASMLLRRAGPGFVEYDVDVQASRAVLRRELSLGGVLSETRGGGDGFGATLQQRLHYQMR